MFQLFQHFLQASVIVTICVALLAGCSSDGEAPPDGYCYRTLGAVDCYTTPESNRPPVGIIENSRPPAPAFENAAAYTAR